MRQLAVLLLIAPAGLSQDAAVNGLVMAVQANDREAVRALSHAYENPDWPGFDPRTLRGPLGKEKSRVVYGQRAIVEFDSGTILWLERRGEPWGCVGWRKDGALSREWLYQDGKRGEAHVPEKAVDGFLEAIRENEPEKAEQLCTHEGWSTGRWSFATIFANTRKAQADLRRIGLSQRNRRAYVLVTIEQNAETRGEFYVLVLKREGGWLLAGVAEKADDAQLFLQDKPWPFRPKDPEALRDELLAMFEQRAAWRMKRLCTAVYRTHEQGARTLYSEALKSGVEAGEPAARGLRGTCAVALGKRKLVLLLLKRREGWRLHGHTDDAAYAARYLAGEVPARK